MLQMAGRYSINAKTISSPHMGVFANETRNNDQMHANS